MALAIHADQVFSVEFLSAGDRGSKDESCRGPHRGTLWDSVKNEDPTLQRGGYLVSHGRGRIVVNQARDVV